MKFKKRAFSTIEAFQITEAMISGKEPLPKDVKMKLVPDFEPNQAPTIQWGKLKNNTYTLFPGCWYIKCLETGEIGIYGHETDFRRVYVEVEG